ncbi:MAG: mechanosensitive ion channel domain-containing protein [Pseudomonadota bacterium]
MDFSKLAEIDFMKLYVIPWSINILLALAIFYIGRRLAKTITKGIDTLMHKAEVEETLRRFLRNIINVVLLVVVIIAALEQLGVNTTSVMAVFAAAGLAVGLALKDSLSSFAAGVLLIIFKPFKIDDYIEAAGTAGTVQSITIFHTVLSTGDNKEVIVPNAQIYAGTIVNYTVNETRRIDLVFSISYDDNIKTAKDLIQQVIDADPRILKEPEPLIAVGALADSSVNLNVRPWVKTDDYWPVYFDLLEKVKETFDANGITIPYPQFDLHYAKPPAP